MNLLTMNPDSTYTSINKQSTQIVLSFLTLLNCIFKGDMNYENYQTYVLAETALSVKPCM